ncbi:MAG: DUF4263 domain-containing protein [Cytophagales bacterium]|nr:DUF4263 domain-containing protein [Cytophagales bacterium]
MLYERNYLELTEQEKSELEKAKKPFSSDSGGVIIDYEKMPKAAFFYESLFPNNMLDIDELMISDRTTRILSDFRSLIDSRASTERDILNFIKSNRAYFIIASVLVDFHFGHHVAYAFPEFELPPDYRVDYLIIGKSSYGHEFVFVELENPYNSITVKDGGLGSTFRKGIKQLSDWNNWIESNFNHLQLMFEKFKGTTCEFPEEFRKLDTTRMHYITVAGRRTDFNEVTYRMARKMMSDRFRILHYDNLLDKAEQVIGNGNYV